jgi:serine/threonine-protein phosphatase 2B catalytic subunit
MPICALVGDRRFFCVHGGLSPELNKLESISAINRFREVPDSGLFADLLWSDPCPAEMDPNNNLGFVNNTARTCSYYFGLFLSFY